MLLIAPKRRGKSDEMDSLLLRDRRAEQMPDYPIRSPFCASNRLASAAPLVRTRMSEARQSACGSVGGQSLSSPGRRLRRKLRRIRCGRRYDFQLLMQMNAIFRKPERDGRQHRRLPDSSPSRDRRNETVGGLTLPSYRGDIVNGPAFGAASTPDPSACSLYRQCRVTQKHAQAFSSAAYADLPRLRMRSAARIGLGIGIARTGTRVPHLFTVMSAAAQLRTGADRVRRGERAMVRNVGPHESGSAIGPVARGCACRICARRRHRSGSNAAHPRCGRPAALIERLDPDISPGGWF